MHGNKWWLACQTLDDYPDHLQHWPHLFMLFDVCFHWEATKGALREKNKSEWSPGFETLLSFGFLNVRWAWINPKQISFQGCRFTVAHHCTATRDSLICFTSLLTFDVNKSIKRSVFVQFKCLPAAAKHKILEEPECGLTVISPTHCYCVMRGFCCCINSSDDCFVPLKTPILDIAIGFDRVL